MKQALLKMKNALATVLTAYSRSDHGFRRTRLPGRTAVVGQLFRIMEAVRGWKFKLQSLDPVLGPPTTLFDSVPADFKHGCGYCRATEPPVASSIAKHLLCPSSWALLGS